MFYVLASHNLYALKRQFETLPKNQTTIIINTLDRDFQDAAQQYCFSEKIRCVITESDGTAATGKNTFLDLFEDDGIPYCVLIDGDDYLTPFGVETYQKIAKSETPPDVVCLFNQVNLNWEKKTKELVFEAGRQDKDPSTIKGVECVGSAVVDWNEFTKGTIITDHYPDVDPFVVNSWIQYAKNIEFGMGVDEITSRVTFMSRKVIPYRFKSFIVGEDTIQYLELKDAFEKGKLTIAALDEEDNPTYIYDLRLSGIALEESSKNEGSGYFNWVIPLGKYIQSMRQAGKLHATKIPLLEV